MAVMSGVLMLSADGKWLTLAQQMPTADKPINAGRNFSATSPSTTLASDKAIAAR
jgi:hypothetical protein